MARIYEHKSKHSLIVLLENTYKKLETAHRSAVYMLLKKIHLIEDELNLRFGKFERKPFKYKSDKEPTEEPTEESI